MNVVIDEILRKCKDAKPREKFMRLMLSVIMVMMCLVLYSLVMEICQS